MNYQSSDPAVLAAWEEFQAAHKAWSAAVDAVPRPPVPEGETFVPTPIVTMSSFSPGAHTLAGVEWTHSLPVPDGWKREGKGYPYTISPKQSTAIGKAAKRTFPAGTRGISLPGMPSTMFVGLSLRSPAIEELDGTIHVSWGDGFTPTGVDPNIWTADIDIPTVVFS